MQEKEIKEIKGIEYFKKVQKELIENIDDIAISINKNNDIIINNEYINEMLDELYNGYDIPLHYIKEYLDCDSFKAIINEQFIIIDIVILNDESIKCFSINALHDKVLYVLRIVTYKMIDMMISQFKY